MPKRSPLETTLSSRYLSAICGPSIFTCSASRNSAAPPTWSIWPCVSQIFSTVTPVCLIAAWIFSTSPPGSITTAFFVGSCQMMVQFCSNRVTGTMIAPALAWVSVWVSVCWVISAQCRFFEVRQGEEWLIWRGTALPSVIPASQSWSEPVGGWGVASRNRISGRFSDGSGRQGLVAARRFLSDLSAVVSGHQCRRGRRHHRDYRAAALPEAVGSRRGLAVADLSLADGRFWLRHLGLCRHRSAVRQHDGFRSAGKRRA